MELRVKLGRTVRHKKYFMSDPEITLIESVGKTEDLRKIFEEMKSDVQIMVEEMEEDEVRIFKERQEAIKNARNLG